MYIQSLLTCLERENAPETMCNLKASALGIREVDFQEVVKTKKH